MKEMFTPENRIDTIGCKGYAERSFKGILGVYCMWLGLTLGANNIMLDGKIEKAAFFAISGIVPSLLFGLVIGLRPRNEN